MAKMNNGYKLLVAKLNEKYGLKDVDLNGRIILNLILKVWDGYDWIHVA
jgi:hypothetical protein